MYRSKQGNIELRIIGYDEPNNGRELHIAELFINGKNCSDKYFTNKWNRLNFRLNEFQFESDDLNYVFIPAEGNSFVIDTSTFSKIDIPYKVISTVQFQRNYFLDDNIFIHYTNEIVQVKLKNKTKLNAI